MIERIILCTNFHEGFVFCEKNGYRYYGHDRNTLVVTVNGNQDVDRVCGFLPKLEYNPNEIEVIALHVPSGYVNVINQFVRKRK